MEGIGRGKEVDAAITIRVDSVGEDVRRHELTQTDGPIEGTWYIYRVDSALDSVIDQGLELGIGPMGFLLATASGEVLILIVINLGGR
jgi:hypothetical protein